MKKIILIVLALTNSVLFSCKQSEETKASPQMLKVMAVHDEVMPKLSNINKLISQIEDKIQVTDSTAVLLAAKQDLQDAHKAMFDWMKGFGEGFDGDEIRKGKTLTAEKQKLLDEEEIKVNALRDQINSSIANAEKILK